MYVQECCVRFIKQIISRFPNTLLWYLVGSQKHTNSRLLDQIQNSEMTEVWRGYSDFTMKLLKLNGVKDQDIPTHIMSLCTDSISIAAPLDMYLGLKSPVENEAHLTFVQKPLPFFDIMKSLQRPIKLWFQCSNGAKIPLLLKFNDEIRKDNRVLDFFAHFNHLKKGITYKNTLKVYSAIPLSDSSGLIEWIDGIQTIRQITNQYSKRAKRDIDMLKSKSILHAGRDGLLKLLEAYHFFELMVIGIHRFCTFTFMRIFFILQNGCKPNICLQALRQVYQ